MSIFFSVPAPSGPPDPPSGRILRANCAKFLDKEGGRCYNSGRDTIPPRPRDRPEGENRDMKYPIHFNPENGWFGDPMPMWHDGVWHLYYTKNVPGKTAPWGHVSTTDFRNFTEHPDPFPNYGPGMPNCTGCICFGEGKFHAFFTGKDEEGPLMYHSVSDDGILFPPATDVIFRCDLSLYRDDTWRDPAVVYDPEAKLWRMVFCAKQAEENGDCFDGGVGFASSPDLYHWTLEKPLSLFGVGRFLECPELFFDRDWNLLYYWHETRFRHAKTLDGDWERYPVISPDRFNFMAARTAFDGTRRLLVGWIQRKSENGELMWGGSMLIPRELTYGENGPQTRFLRELDGMFPKPVSYTFTPTDPRWKIEGDRIRCETPVGGTMLKCSALPERYLMRFKFSLTGESPVLTLIVGATAVWCNDIEKGYQVIFDAPDRILRIRRHYLWDQRGDVDTIPFEPEAENEIALVYDAAAPGGAILELELNGKQTLTSRLNEGETGALALTMQDGGVDLTGFRILGEE